MADALGAAVEAMLGRAVDPDFAELARQIADICQADAVLFYGSSFRTGDREGVADFYALSDGPRKTGGAWRWPGVSYHEIAIGGTVLRAKVAAMTHGDFARAAAGRSMDTTVWARFAQPVRLPYARDAAATSRVAESVADSIVTATRFAAALGPPRGTAEEYWLALFRATYEAEFRVEKQSRATKLLAAEPAHFDTMLPLAWRRLGLLGDDDAGGGELVPRLAPPQRARWLREWRRRRRVGKPLNVARLVRAAFTFDGAARYGLWKIERHTGVHIPVTPFRERHPVLAAPAVLWRLWREGRR